MEKLHHRRQEERAQHEGVEGIVACAFGVPDVLENDLLTDEPIRFDGDAKRAGRQKTARGIDGERRLAGDRFVVQEDARSRGIRDDLRGDVSARQASRSENGDRTDFRDRTLVRALSPDGEAGLRPSA